MFLTTHAAAGLLLSQYIDTPLPLFGASFASHFLLDFIPHGDTDLYKDDEWRVQKKFGRVVVINAIDLAALTFLIVLILGNPNLPASNLMMIAILGSILPDFLHHFFPIIHERMSWLFVVRWLHAISKTIGLRMMVRGQNWLHDLFHHRIIRTDVPFQVGLLMQIVLVGVVLVLLS